MLKKFSFYSLLLLIIFSFFLIFDFILSNTFLKHSHCVNFSEYFYELKKNCSGKYRFKKSFPLVETYTDENGFRVGKKNIKKDINKKNIFLEPVADKNSTHDETVQRLIKILISNGWKFKDDKNDSN